MEDVSENDSFRASSPTPSSRMFKGEKYVIVAVLLTVNLLNYIDRFTIAGVLTQLQSYFHMDDKQSGMLQTVFVVFYLSCAPICGYLGDRYNRKRIMAIGLSVWIVAVMASSFVGRQHFWLFVFLRGIVGVGEASYSTLAPSLIADSFAGRTRSLVLMIFYFAIPVGSGLGYIGGAYVSLFAGSWQWGVRFTPLLGIFCLALVVFVLEEPSRGAAEHAEPTSPTGVKEDIRYFLSVKTFTLTTLGFTANVFAIGSLAWWAPSLIEHAYCVSHGTTTVPDGEKASISLKFGLITAGAGLLGVTVGSTFSQAWREGRWGLRKCGSADAVVCGMGSLAAVPFLFLTLITASHYIDAAYCLMFIAITCACFNWAINVDMLMYVIVARRRAMATAIQTMFSHLCGDASSPYIVGAISDWVRGSDDSSAGKFFSLQTALFLPNAALILGAVFYLLASFHLLEDKRTAEHDMHLTHSDLLEDEGDDIVTLVRD